MQRIEFRDANEFNYMVSVPVIGQDEKMVLRMWVAYDRGRRYSQYDYSEVKRGYYLYFSFEEISSDYPARILSTHKDNCRLYLGEVNRRSEGWARDFSSLAAEIVCSVIKEIFADLVFDWEHLSSNRWSGRGSGVGLFCDCYRVFQPKKNWFYSKG